MTAAKLRGYTRKELAQLARQHRIAGWHDMRKEELVQALARHERNRRRRDRARNRAGGAAASSCRDEPRAGKNGTPPKKNGTPACASRKPGGDRRDVTRDRRDLSSLHRPRNAQKADSLEARSRDPFFIHASWSFTPSAIARAEAALGIDWHQAIPVIRLFDMSVGEDGQPHGRTWVRDIEIHNHVDHWYVPVDHPQHRYKLQIGYRTPTGRFFSLACSRTVRTPRPGSNGTVDRSWKKETKRGRIPPHAGRGQHATARSSRHVSRSNGGSIDERSDFEFRLDAELIVHGSTHPRAELTLLGEPVKLTKDGRFSLRFALPDGRQVIPAVTVTPSGEEQRTIVLAVERNTKKLDPQPTDELM